MNKTRKKQYLNRLNYLKGHLEGVRKMVEEGKYCIDIIQQNQAVISAIEKLNHMILEDHLNTCVTRAIRGKSKKEREQKIKEILTVFRTKL